MGSRLARRNERLRRPGITGLRVACSRARSRRTTLDPSEKLKGLPCALVLKIQRQ